MTLAYKFLRFTPGDELRRDSRETSTGQYPGYRVRTAQNTEHRASDTRHYHNERKKLTPADAVVVSFHIGFFRPVFEIVICINPVAARESLRLRHRQYALCSVRHELLILGERRGVWNGAAPCCMLRDDADLATCDSCRMVGLAHFDPSRLHNLGCGIPEVRCDVVPVGRPRFLCCGIHIVRGCVSPCSASQAKIPARTSHISAKAHHEVDNLPHLKRKYTKTAIAASTAIDTALTGTGREAA